jgi:prenyl protein peptidase
MTIFHLIDERVPIPVITPLAAGVGSSLLTLCYVGGIYISNRTRIGAARGKDGALLTRDDPVILKSRLKTVSATSLASFVATGAYIKQVAFSREPSFLAVLSSLRLLGLPLPVPSLLHSNVLPFQPSLTLYTFHHVMPSIVIPFLLTSTFYLGTLYTYALDGKLPFQKNFSLKSSVYPIFDNIYGLRNYVFGPFTEEVVFRGCVLPLHILAGVSIKKTIFLTPFYFGIGAS